MKSLRIALGLAVVVLGIGCATTPPAEVRKVVPAPPPIANAPANAPAVWPAGAPDIFAQSAILIDARTGEVLFQKNADARRAVASTQKLLTALIVARAGNLDEIVTIGSPETRVEPTKLGLRVGERYPRRQLLEAIMVKSANDACSALARNHSGSESAFAEKMNATAWQLGARSSNFANSSGLAHAWGKALMEVSGAASTLAVLVLVVVAAVILSEVASNTAAATLVIPVGLGLADVTGTSVIAVTMAGALASSFGFMMPISTAPNAMAFGTGQVTMRQMVTTGFIFDIVGAVVVVTGVLVLCA